MKQLIILLAIVFTFTRCGEDGTDNPSDFDRTELLINLADGFIYPALNNFESNVVNLKSAVTTFNTTPNQTNLDLLRASFQTTYQSWQYVNIFEFGPAENIAFRGNVNTYPTDKDNIANLISSGSYNLDAISNFDSKGLPAIDYILYGIADSDTEIIALFDTNADKEKYKQFFADIAEDLVQKTKTVVTAWTNGYQSDFKNNKTNDIGSSISLFINAYINHFESRFRTLKIGLPAGVFSIEEMSFPEECEGLYSGVSKTLILENFNQIEKLYYGNSDNQINSIGLDDYLIGVNASDVDETIKSRIAAINVALGDLTNPLSEQVVNDRETVLAVYAKIQVLVTSLKADMASALSIQITYTDTDGD